METNDQQLEDLKKKIEKYRQAVDSLKTRRDDSSQLEKRMKSLEEQFDQFRTQQMELHEQMKVVQSFMDELKKGEGIKSSAEEGNRAREEESRLYEKSTLKTVPSFNALKKLAGETPVLYSNSQTSSQEAGSPNRITNKKHPYKALLSIDAQQIDPSIIQNDTGRMDEGPEHPLIEQSEVLTEDKESIQVETSEAATEKPEKVNARAAGFWKGFLRN